MAKNIFSSDDFEYSRLLSVLNQAKIKTGDNASYEVIKQLITGSSNWSQFSQLTFPSLLYPGTSINWAELIAELEAIIITIIAASYITKDDETAGLINSRQLTAGRFVSLDYNTAGKAIINSNPPIFLPQDGIDGLDGFPGRDGIIGSNGATGPAGLVGIGLDGIDGDEGFPIPGPAGPSNASDFIKIEEQTPSATGVVTFSSLGLYTHLEIRYSGRGDAVATSSLLNLTFNGDTGSNYDRENTSAAAAVISAAESLGATSAAIGSITAASGDAGMAGVGVVKIFDYRGTTFQKGGVASSCLRRSTATANTLIQQHAIGWRSTVAITSITITLGSGNYVAGSKFSLYGLR